MLTSHQTQRLSESVLGELVVPTFLFSILSLHVNVPDSWRRLKIQFSFFLSFSGGIRFLTQGLTLARQLLTSLTLFYFMYFSDSVLHSCLGQAQIAPPLPLPLSSWDGRCPPSCLACWLKWDFTNFLLRLTSHCNPPDFCFLIS
jgi:hypothetical protein